MEEFLQIKIYQYTMKLYQINQHVLQLCVIKDGSRYEAFKCFTTSYLSANKPSLDLYNISSLDLYISWLAKKCYDIYDPAVIYNSSPHDKFNLYIHLKQFYFLNSLKYNLQQELRSRPDAFILTNRNECCYNG
jgi:hypothetical protein